MTRFLPALVAVWLSASAARADGPALPGRKVVHAIHRIETQEEHPDYVFVQYRTGLQYDARKLPGDPWGRFEEAAYVDLTPSNPLVLDLTSYPDRELIDKDRCRERAMLMWVPREVARTHKTALELAHTAWEQEPQLVGTGTSNFDSRTDAWSWGAENERTLTYRVQRKKSGGGLELVFVRSTGTSALPCCVVGVLVPMTAYLGGYWLVRRARRPRLPGAGPVK
jgi:hypothetical protein